jgi:hypothetical protein
MASTIQLLGWLSQKDGKCKTLSSNLSYPPHPQKLRNPISKIPQKQTKNVIVKNNQELIISFLTTEKQVR